MQIITRLAELRPALASLRPPGSAGWALIPTMGNLHLGHAHLIRAARARCPLSVVSLFVNPSQFGPNEDLQLYPRTPEQDVELLRTEGVDLLFMPGVEQIYPAPDPELTIDIPQLSRLYCGRERPNHFRGVLTVVNLLFNLVQPELAAFGKKDYQQLRLIELMTNYLHYPIEILRVDTGRDRSGLALSSRNSYLTPEQLQRAPELYQQLQACARALRAGAPPEAATQPSWQALEAAGFVPEYLQVADPESLQPLASAQPGMIILAAARLGRARLIDNLEVQLNAA